MLPCAALPEGAPAPEVLARLANWPTRPAIPEMSPVMPEMPEVMPEMLGIPCGRGWARVRGRMGRRSGMRRMVV